MPRRTSVAVSFVLATFLCRVDASTIPQSQRTAKKKTAHAAAATTGHKPVASGKTAATGSRRVVVVARRKIKGKWIRVSKVVHTPPAPTYQLHPDPDRYTQIQQALANAGYFKGQVNGEWGDDSVAALKQFQTDRSLPNDGHISSLSLIGLGLGPARLGGTIPTPPPSSALPASSAPATLFPAPAPNAAVSPIAPSPVTSFAGAPSTVVSGPASSSLPAQQ